MRSVIFQFAFTILPLTSVGAGHAYAETSTAETVNSSAKDQMSFDSYPEKAPKPTHAQGFVPPQDSTNSGEAPGQAAVDATRDPSGNYPPEVVPYDPSYTGQPPAGQVEYQDPNAAVPPGM